MKNKTKKGQLPPCKYPNAQFSFNSGRKEFNVWPNTPPTPSGRKIDWYCQREPWKVSYVEKIYGEQEQRR